MTRKTIALTFHILFIVLAGLTLAISIRTLTDCVTSIILVMCCLFAGYTGRVVDEEVNKEKEK